MNKNWWKILCVVMLIYVFIAGFMMPVPRLDILNETIRNLYFHVPMWFTQMFLYTVGLVYSIRYLMLEEKSTATLDISADGFSKKMRYDIIAKSTITAGTVFGCLGLLTGMVWGKNTWGSYWSDDPKLNSTAIGMLLYFAYFILRGSMEDIDKRAKLAAVYNIFCYVLFMVLIMVIPRMKEFSIHPGNGGNPAFSKYDLDSNMRLVFYPAVIAWILLGSWISTLLIRIDTLKAKFAFNN